VAPANQAFGRFWATVFTFFFGVLMSFYRFSAVFLADCGEAASSKVLLIKICFLAETNSKPGFDSSTRVFQGFG